MKCLCRTISLALAVFLVVPLIVSHVSAAPQLSEWSAPVNLGANVNSAFDEGGPAISEDGLSLYFQSSRPGGSGNSDVWVARRESIEDAWGLPRNLPSNVNSTFNDLVPNLSRDGHHLYFASDRPGGSGNLDLWVSRRADTHEDFGALGWQPAVNLGSIVNTASIDAGPSYFADGEAGAPQLFFASDRPGGPGGLDIYVSEQNADGSFGPAVLVAELNTPATDQAPDIRDDGLEMFVMSNRGSAIQGLDLWVSNRQTVFDPWSAPVNLGTVVNTAYVEGQPSLSSDRGTLYFYSNRTGGRGGDDLYMTTRIGGND
jgi:hypothetical protein